jgi:hypothetical protein
MGRACRRQQSERATWSKTEVHGSGNRHRSTNGSVAEAYANQLDYCRNNGATITARSCGDRRAAATIRSAALSSRASATGRQPWPTVAAALGGALHGAAPVGRGARAGADLRREPRDDHASWRQCAA